jgi:MoaA/NifB/PqqE/SkfB family radical SAM enzyme
MIARLAWRFLRETDPRLLARFAYTVGWKGMRAVQRFEQRKARGNAFPAFLFLSITNACNLRCQGCWVTPSCPPQHLDLDLAHRLIDAARGQGSFFFGILGGEPFLHPGLFELLAAHPDCYFQVFTNGTLITDDVAARLRELGNVTPLISIEGLEAVSDERRGGTDVLEATLAGLARCRRARLITGVASSICRSNLDDLASEAFARRLVDLGVHYLWYYLYRAVGPRPCPELALDREQILRLRQFMVDLRSRVPLLVVDAYWDHDGYALCPAAVGISHHINPFGDFEPCPIIQFAADSLGQSADPGATIAQSPFMEAFRRFAAAAGRGCIVMEGPDRLTRFLREQGARDCTGRGSGFAELGAACCRLSHRVPGGEIPERHWAYRFAKKRWFFGFGAYG